MLMRTNFLAPIARLVVPALLALSAISAWAATTPTVTTWPTALYSIRYGTMLVYCAKGGTTSASVPGSFDWTTPSAKPATGITPCSMTFTPTDKVNYTSVSTNINVTVLQAITSVTTSPTALITYGQTLASAVLSGGTAMASANGTSSVVAGSFAFTTPSTAPAAGTASQRVTFTPTDGANYLTATGNASVTVNQATSTVTTWPTASAIFLGQTLEGSMLSGGSASVAGTFVWTTPGTAPGAGSASQGVTFTPADAVDYSSVTGTASVVVVVPPGVTTVAASALTSGGATLNAAINPLGNPVNAFFQYATTSDFAGKITVSTLAGSYGYYGDGTGTNAQFYGPMGVAVDANGNVYVADTNNNCIRKVTPAGVVTTLAGCWWAGGGYLDDVNGTTAQFNGPSGVAVDASGNVYVSDAGNNCIRKVTPAGAVTTLAGSAINPPGYAEGTGTAAKFWAPAGVAVDTSGNVYVADYGNARIRKVTATGVVTTLAGTGTNGYKDGPGAAAQFTYPSGVAVDASGSVYVADSSNNRIRKVWAGGVVTTLAGSDIGYTDGTGTNAQFNFPRGVAVDASGNVYVSEVGNSDIRKVTAAGVVTTLAQYFYDPCGVAVDTSGNVYVADTDNNLIRLIATLYPVSHLAQSGLTGSDSVNVNLALTGLLAGTTYYYRSVATNNTGSVYGDVMSFILSKADQTITFGTLAAKTVGDATFDLTATANSGLTVGYVSSDPTVASVAGNTVTLLKAGTTDITASQAGDGSHNAATSVTQTLTVMTTAVSLYKAWISGYPTLTGTDADPGADTDNDGVTNLMEYALGTDPTSGASGTNTIAYEGTNVTVHGQPIPRDLSPGTGGVDYRAVFGRRKNYLAAGLTYTMQFSADNSHWVDSSAQAADLHVLTTGDAVDGTMDAVSVPYPWFIPVTGGYKKPTFFRIKVTSN